MTFLGGLLAAVTLAVTNHAGSVVSGELTSVADGRFTIGGRTYPLAVLPIAEQTRVKAAAGLDVRSPREKRVEADLAYELKRIDVRLAEGEVTPEQAEELRRARQDAAAWRGAAAKRPLAWAEKLERPGLPNLHRVDSNLYRSAQPTAEGMTNLVALGVRTVVNLRDNHSDADEIGGLPLVAKRIEMFAGNPKIEQVKAFLAVLDDTNAVPVLVHCQHGADRTGTMCALYRILRQGWNVEDAIDEMKKGGYGYHSVWVNLPRFIRKAAKSQSEER